MPDLTLRTFEIAYESIETGADTLVLIRKELDAGYFQQGLGNVGSGTDGDGFIVFKDCQHKPVFAVRASAVVSIEEIRQRESPSITVNVSGQVASEEDLARTVRNAVRRDRPGGASTVAA